ncbi:hypothetical protein NDU88_002144 [Pleurodeles waltl]|uniref:Uncharacterized protein n=1 Tax=Pleurodeles waltl TaxID=8319 RepID=A0AAV7M2I4_PLEWA|nr:hypothetical protein NDU88_002144 [Pleurodeles waltl]
MKTHKVNSHMQQRLSWTDLVFQTPLLFIIKYYGVVDLPLVPSQPDEEPMEPFFGKGGVQRLDLGDSVKSLEVQMMLPACDLEPRSVKKKRERRQHVTPVLSQDLFVRQPHCLFSCTESLQIVCM